MRMTLQRIPDGPAGVRETLQQMRQIVDQSKRRPTARALAVRLVQDFQQKDYEGEAERLHQFVRDVIRYTRDIRGIETLHTPEQVLKQRAGDCDDKAMLLSALLEAIGHTTRFRAVGFMPNVYSHVLVDVLLGGEWVAAETTEPVPLGWTPPNVRSVMLEPKYAA